MMMKGDVQIHNHHEWVSKEKSRRERKREEEEVEKKKAREGEENKERCFDLFCKITWKLTVHLFDTISVNTIFDMLLAMFMQRIAVSEWEIVDPISDSSGIHSLPSLSTNTPNS
jgi:hypothetical protein